MSTTKIDHSMQRYLDTKDVGFFKEARSHIAELPASTRENYLVGLFAKAKSGAPTFAFASAMLAAEFAPTALDGAGPRLIIHSADRRIATTIPGPPTGFERSVVRDAKGLITHAIDEPFLGAPWAIFRKVERDKDGNVLQVKTSVETLSESGESVPETDEDWLA